MGSTFKKGTISASWMFFGTTGYKIEIRHVWSHFMCYKYNLSINHHICVLIYVLLLYSKTLYNCYSPVHPGYLLQAIGRAIIPYNNIIYFVYHYILFIL